jgi:hypothetical protein
VSHGHVRAAGLAVSFGFCALGIGYAWNSLNTPGPTPEQIRIETDAQRLQLTQAQKQAKMDEINAKLDSEWHFDRASTWLRLLVIGSLATLTVCVPAGAVAGGLHLWHNRDMPTKDMRIPLRGMDFDQKRTMIRDQLQVRAIQAANPQLPKGLEHLHTVHSPRITGGSREPFADEPALTVSRIPDVPNFRRLIEAGEVGGNRPLLFGYAATGDQRHNGQEHFSIGFAGQPNFGKSNSAGVVLAQHILHGADAVVCDLQAGNKRSLASRLAPLEEAGLFLIPTADSPKLILAAVRTVHGELKAREARQARWRKEHGPGSPAPRNQLLVLCIDEWPTVLRGELADELPTMLADIHDSGPKMDVITELMAQQWGTNVVGGAMVRNSVPAAIIHCCRADEARMVSGLRGDSIPGDTMALGQGEAYMVAPGVGPVRITVPRLEAADLVEVARLAAAQRRNGGRLVIGAVPGAAAGAEENPLLLRSGPAPATGSFEYGAVAPSRARALEARVLDCLHEGRTVPQIVEYVYQVNRSRGTKYAEATAEVMAIIREATRPALTVVNADAGVEETE